MTKEKQQFNSTKCFLSFILTGYGTIFIKHDIMVKGKLCTVTSKLQPVYYAPEISYRLFSVRSLLQKGYCLKGDKAQISITKPSGDTVLEFYPHTSDPNIYWLNVKIVKDQNDKLEVFALPHGSYQTPMGLLESIGSLLGVQWDWFPSQPPAKW